MPGSPPPHHATPGPVSAPAFRAAAQSVLDTVIDGQPTALSSAAERIAASVRAGGVVQAFGTGHSEALALEIAGRAGGLIPSNRIALRDVVLFGGEPASTLSDGILERDPSVARRLYTLAAPDPRDVFVIASNSGVNGSIVEMALLAKENGHDVIAVTSAQHTARVTPRHPCGRRLSEIADVVIDNGAPYGDSLLSLPDGGTACAVSSITGAFLVQMIGAEVVRLLLESGQQPPVYLSANIPGGDEHNEALEAKYSGRIRRTA